MKVRNTCFLLFGGTERKGGCLMIRKFSQQFLSLINKNVPRSFLQSEESRSRHLNETGYGKLLGDRDKIFPAPEHGFVAHYIAQDCDKKDLPQAHKFIRGLGKFDREKKSFFSS